MADDPQVLVLDAGTTSTRAMVFAADGRVAALAQRELTQFYPEPGWVEHDAAEIWAATLACAREAIAAAGPVACLGITNQRETLVAWDKATGQPLHRAIVWQDRRTADFCTQLREAGHESEVQERTGLLLDPYFSATKMRWLLDNVPAVSAAGDRLAFGTVESWLVWNLTGGAHLTDASNASRTSLLPLTEASWDPYLCDLFGVPIMALPQVVDCAGVFGRTLPGLLGDSEAAGAIPITGLAGDQQAATIGQGCLSPGDTKATFGTGAFVLANMGSRVPASRHRLLGTVLHQLGGKRCYALEGSVFVAGSMVQWLRDSLGLIASAAETAQLAASVPDSGGVVIVPALSGLGAPHWRPEARAAITGLSFASGRAQVVRAALEAMTMQIGDLAEAFAADGAEWRSLRIDGGMSANEWMAQDLADMLALPVERPAFIETTALGAAMLASLGAGLMPDLATAAGAMRGGLQTFVPSKDEVWRAARRAAWRNALAKV